jgi:hypothetical protein
MSLVILDVAMKHTSLQLGLSSLLVGIFSAAPVRAQEPYRELVVHLAQANNESPYAFVRARFEPGEAPDPWAVRFVDEAGDNVSYFVWDSMTWGVARNGREDWGHRFAALNHHPGDAPAALQMRPHRLALAQEQFPELGRMLAARDEASQQWSDSVCAALYLVRHRVPPLGKSKLTMRVYARRQFEPERLTLTAQPTVGRSAASGELALVDLPGNPSVRWQGREMFRYAGFEIDDKDAGAGPVQQNAHADAGRPFAIAVEKGLITRVHVTSETDGRAGSGAHWQCTYWLFPEGSYVALQGFSLDNTAGYLGGGFAPAVWRTNGQPEEVHPPEWELPWSLYQIDDAAFAAVHLCPDAPLAVGYGNNPFNASVPDSYEVRVGDAVKTAGQWQLSLRWRYELTDPRIYRLFHPHLDGERDANLAEVTDLRKTLLETGRLTNVPDDVSKDGTPVWPPERVRSIEEALSYVKWQPGIDWIYRQHLVGVGASADEAESALRQVLGAAVGWIDRPIDEAELAELLVQCSLRSSSGAVAGAHQQAWPALPHALQAGDGDAVRRILGTSADPRETAEAAMSMIKRHVAAGGKAIEGTTKGGGEGWHNNPAYAAVDVPVALRVIDHFDLYALAPHDAADYRTTLLAWADFTLRVLAG